MTCMEMPDAAVLFRMKDNQISRIRERLQGEVDRVVVVGGGVWWSVAGWTIMMAVPCSLFLSCGAHDKGVYL